MTREQREARVWSQTHADYKGHAYGLRAVLVLREGATVLCPLTELTEAEIDARIRRPR